MKFFAVCFALLLATGCSSSTVPAESRGPRSSDACTGIPVSVNGPAGSIDDVSSAPTNVISMCQARAALGAGQFVVSYSGDAIIAAADGDTPQSDVFSDGNRAPQPNGPASPPPANSNAGQRTEPVHAYGIYIDPNNTAPYTVSADAYTLAEAKKEVSSWIATTRVKTSASYRSGSADVSTDSVSPPSYDAAAWTLVASATVLHRYASYVTQLPPHLTSDYGDAGAIVDVYRLNSRSPAFDDFLVDTYYTQTPRWHGKQFFFPSEYTWWWNSVTELTVAASDPWHTTIRPVLVDFAPATPITVTLVTNTVGKSLSKSGTTSNTAYSRTEQQPSVTTTVRGSLGGPDVFWRDKYEDVVRAGSLGYNNNPPGTTTTTFAGDRLAVFEVPRSVNDNVPAGKTPGINIAIDLYSEVHGFVGLGGLGQLYKGYFKSGSSAFAPEPIFSASPTTIDVSKSGNTASNPAVVAVTAERPDHALKLTWHAVSVPAFVTTNVDRHGITGSGSLKIVPKNVQVGDSGFITLSTEPPGGSDSLRDGSYQIAVQIVP